ncbi:conserved hypothetical protein [Candidatus Sulfopaludibacter sp. SbA3]|nr:conserved hypothetical protein [Candidatus Sulfopaludibacter sp. SbA3]
MSRELATKIRVPLEELAIVRQQFEPLLSMPSEANIGVIETSAASAMLHSFYTEIKKVLKLVAREWDGHLPSSDSWHKDLLSQMSEATPTRPAVLSKGLIEVLNEFLAFRHLFRGASIALMRWEKLHPLVAKIDRTYERTRSELEAFALFIDLHAENV